jgi:hypothetical protein
MSISLLQVEQAVKHWAAFVKAHEKMAVIILASLLLFHFGQKGLALWDAHDARNASIAQQKVNADVTTTKAQDAIVANLQAQLAQVSATANAAMAEARKKATEAKAADDAAPLPQLAQTWNSKLGYDSSHPHVTATNDTVTVDSAAAHKTVDALEDLDAQISINQAQKSNLDSCLALTGGLKTDVDNWKKQFNDEHAARLDDAKVFKGEIRKAYFKGLKHGIIIGVVGTVAATIAILH